MAVGVFLDSLSIVGGGVGWDNNVHVSLHTDALICTAPSSYSWCGVWGGVWVGARRLFR